MIAEGVLTTKNAPPGQALCAFVGLVNSTVITVYVVFYTVPRWRTLVAEPIQAYEGTYRSITLTYLMTTMALLGHQLAFYSLQNLSVFQPALHKKPLCKYLELPFIVDLVP
eukprot:SAG31_NODE_3861_length_3812_cov_4.053865_3_plen_111_part_00